MKNLDKYKKIIMDKCIYDYIDSSINNNRNPLNDNVIFNNNKITIKMIHLFNYVAAYCFINNINFD